MARWSNDKANKRGRWGEAAAGLSRALFPFTLFQVVLVMFACCVWHKNNRLRRTCFLSSQWASFRDECSIGSDWFDELGSIKMTEWKWSGSLRHQCDSAPPSPHWLKLAARFCLFSLFDTPLFISQTRFRTESELWWWVFLLHKSRPRPSTSESTLVK